MSAAEITEVMPALRDNMFEIRNEMVGIDQNMHQMTDAMGGIAVQMNQMALGVFERNLEWGMILLGAGIAVAVTTALVAALLPLRVT